MRPACRRDINRADKGPCVPGSENRKWNRLASDGFAALVRALIAHRSLLQPASQGPVGSLAQYLHGLGEIGHFENGRRLAVAAAGATVRILNVQVLGA